MTVFYFTLSLSMYSLCFDLFLGRVKPICYSVLLKITLFENRNLDQRFGLGTAALALAQDV